MKKTKFFACLLMLLPLTSCKILVKYGEYEDAYKYKVIDSNGETYNESLKKIDVSWVKGDITITSTTQYSGVTIFEKTTEMFEQEFLCHLYRSEDFLNVKYCGSNLSMPTNLDKDLIIYVPMHITLNEITISSEKAAILISSINCNSLKINNVSGNVSVDKVNCEEIEYEGVSGSFTSVVTSQTNKIDIEQTSGSTILSLPGDIKGFEVDFSSVSGTLSTDFEMIKKEEDYYYGDVENKCLEIEFESISGGLYLTKHKVEK